MTILKQLETELMQLNKLLFDLIHEEFFNYEQLNTRTNMIVPNIEYEEEGEAIPVQPISLEDYLFSNRLSSVSTYSANLDSRKLRQYCISDVALRLNDLIFKISKSLTLTEKGKLLAEFEKFLIQYKNSTSAKIEDEDLKKAFSKAIDKLNEGLYYKHQDAFDILDETIFDFKLEFNLSQEELAGLIILLEDMKILNPSSETPKVLQMIAVTNKKGSDEKERVKSFKNVYSRQRKRSSKGLSNKLDSIKQRIQEYLEK